MTKEQLLGMKAQLDEEVPRLDAEYKTTVKLAEESDKAVYEAEKVVAQTTKELQLAESLSATATAELITQEKTSEDAQKQIIQLEATVAEKDGAIQYVNSVITSIENEIATLNTTLEASDAKFVQKTAAHQVYVATLGGANQALSTFYLELQEKQASYDTAAKAFAASDGEYQTIVKKKEAAETSRTTLLQESGRLATQILAAQATEAVAINAASAAEMAAEVASLNYNLALLNKEYATAAIAQDDALKAWSAAKAALEEATAILAASPNDTTLQVAKQMAGEQVEIKRKAKESADAAITTLLSRFDDKSKDNVAVAIAALDEQIAAEATLETGYRQKQQAATEIGVKQKEAYNIAMADFVSYTAKAQSYAEEAVKKEQDASTRRREASTAETMRDTLNTEIQILSTAILTLDSSILQKDRLFSTFTVELSTLRQEARLATKDVSDTILEETKAKSNLDTARTELSALEVEVRKLENEIEVDQIRARQATTTSESASLDIEIAKMAMDIGVYSFKESFVRQKRIGAQNAYDAAIDKAIAALTASGPILAPSGATPSGPSLGEVSQNPEVVVANAALQLINQVLDAYDLFQQSQASVQTFLLSMKPRLEERSRANQEVVDIQTVLTANPTDNTIRSALIKAEERQRSANKSYEDSIASYRQSLQQLAALRAAIDERHRALFPNATELASQENQIKGFLDAGLALA